MRPRFLLAAVLSLASPALAQTTEPRVLEVDRLGTTPYKTLGAAARAAKPGDIIRVKPDTGPYREILAIKTSGTAESPIVFDGGGNVITGFEPLTGWEEKDGVVTCHLSFFPCVLTYKGERLVQDYTTGQFTKYADLKEAKDTLTLRPGVEQTDWEISRRAFAVQISDVSHQVYRNVRASGSTNDGFNLHGTGTDLVFENIEGFNNLDEGYSAHDTIESTIKGAKFWGNDNGLANVGQSVTTIQDTDIWSNLGFGLLLAGCSGTLDDVRCWNNGVMQVQFVGAKVASEKVTAYKPSFATRIWASYNESKKSDTKSPPLAYRIENTVLTGTPPVVSAEPAPPEGPKPK